ncbi:AMP-binding protein [Streptomyces sp. DSM 44915]|uniref:AMP-binding protein n=1 Tax=Streptomyces chisholmiae TaxID=3075540 RepID=A0ABU2JVW9_9ACTN|nr:AMP-binding protein [Streptomyces sp. DSM 44915]MDT0269140.1 AMP-binding protein [Streptomyces sp. DSM 44915]
MSGTAPVDETSVHRLTRAAHLSEPLRHHAAADPDRVAVRFVADPDQPGVTLSYAELDRAAHRLADRLGRDYPPGSRLLLAFPTGLDCVTALVACLYAGLVPVPVPLPGNSRLERRRLLAIAGDAGAPAVLTDAEHHAALVDCLAEQLAAGLDVLPVRADPTPGGPRTEPPPADREHLALLQYTSGSTGDPKGVRVSHGNLLHNVVSLSRHFGMDRNTTFGGWIPLYHDMGLMGILLPSLLLGGRCVLMSPTAFLKRPQNWLRLIDTHDIRWSAAPNFAYEYCCRRITPAQVAQLDLSRWRYAANGSEPVQAATLRQFAAHFAPAGFRPDALVSCYGMAEATVFVSGANPPRPPVLADAAGLERGELLPATGDAPHRALVGCGHPDDYQVRVVDPATRLPLPDGRIGEIWLHGPSVSTGYWNNPDATEATFGGRLPDTAERFLRTGDLGVRHDGQLHITGRIKEMLIIHGRNLYPHDIEHELRAAHPELAGLVGAAFAVPATAPDGTAGEALVVTHEVGGRPDAERAAALTAAMRQTVLREFGTPPAAVLLVRRGTVPRTTSGKVRRTAVRELFAAGALTPLHADDTPALRYPPPVFPDPSAAARLGRHLAAHRKRGAALDPETVLADDTAERFPTAACELLDAYGLPESYVPTAHGGRLAAYPDLLDRLRTVAAHDLTLAVAHGKTFLGAVTTWVAGTPEQAGRLGARIAEGAVVSWALTERAHGADLLAGEVTAVLDGDHWCLTGEKQLINNATRGDLVCVLARTDPAGGPRGFSLFLVDKHATPPDSYRHLPKIPTHGIRGADISGIAFDRTPVPDAQRIGAPGTGLETVLVALQLTRTVCAALSLGAADQALALTTDFVRERRLYGRTLAELPRIRGIVGESAAALLLADVVTGTAARAIHTLPTELSVVAPVTKAFVPTLTAHTLAELGDVLGVRAYLSESHAHGRFARLERDHRIVGIFDGSTAVNRHYLISRFPSLARAAARRPAAPPDLAATFDPARPLPAARPDRLKAASTSGCSVLDGLPATAGEVLARVAAGTAPAALRPLVAALTTAHRRLAADLAAHRPAAGPAPAAAFDLAARYEYLFAAAASLHLWVARAPRQPADDPLWAEARWLRACLTRALAGLDAPAADPDAYRELADHLLSRQTTPRLSLFGATHPEGIDTP